ncbi:MAG: ABC transporter ATP-binding protein/permease [Acetobacter fabarum]|jgi:ATP-binding cassette subfamily B protein|uniref:ABC transporter ATP-binding protein n=1 Tax=Acetobacter fabarum TaxID=483199 RepID=UPI002432BFB5|nr:ABC transporter ATP-binding protein [Acetobacter fabarum]MCH4026367.1 ABC transporter ATP-binding protein/permease [Acetobacter fabarum]MCH4055736.1 ABC transporter ATP-binding protein/permease [Acetobacter fabarum]MCH4085771.1 ABC transporter ATP-binding protein/permease [Acetobacter fabarum]MCH4136986.1 ABC transporter ATP-binding protein/permease [Acetobacter fabarum]MCI1323241.1 ABC transporter ATP-binding protein/permease [Acetobacter fabarum]
MRGYYKALLHTLVADPALRTGFVYGVASSLTEAAGYILLLLSVQWMADGRGSMTFALLILLGLAVAFGLQALFRAQGLVQDFTGTYRAMSQIRLCLLDHLMALPAQRQLPDERARLLDLMTSRFAAVQDIFTHLWGIVIPGMALPVLLLALIGVLSFSAAAVLALSLPAVAGMMLLAFRLLDKADAGLAFAQEAYAQATLTLLEGAGEIRFFDPQGQIFSRAQAATDNLKTAQMALEVAPAPAIMGYALAAQTGMALAIGVLVMSFQQKSLSAGAVFAVIILTYRFARCVVELAGQIAGLRFARNTLRRMSLIMVQPGMAQTQKVAEPEGYCLHFPNASVLFDADNPSAGGLAPIEGTIRQGTKIALVGISGSGKTTLAHLALRLQDVGAGAITIGGADLRSMDRNMLARSITLVPQDVHLFEGTIADNIRLGCPAASEAAVLAAMKQAHAHEFIQRLPHGLNTEIRAVATALSGGEKQRLAIARALLMNAPLLVMDEATSQLDTMSETAIRNTLQHIGGDRTLLTIAHRLWIAQDADEIWVMENGHIVERGTHKTLMSFNSTYARLWHAQQRPRSWVAPNAPLN